MHEINFLAANMSLDGPDYNIQRLKLLDFPRNQISEIKSLINQMENKNKPLLPVRCNNS